MEAILEVPSNLVGASLSGTLVGFKTGVFIPILFFWEDSMNEHQAHELLNLVANSEVVILGGGNSSTGLSRYKVVGEHFFGDRDLFRKIYKIELSAEN